MSRSFTFALVLLLAGMACASTAAAQPSRASRSLDPSDCDPAWNATVDDARACDEGTARVVLARPAERSRALVAAIYADLARGDLASIAEVLDEHVLWVEGAGSSVAGRHVGPGTVAAVVLPVLAAERVKLDSLVAEGSGRVVAVESVRRGDGTSARVHTVWHLVAGRLVGVERHRTPTDSAR